MAYLPPLGGPAGMFSLYHIVVVIALIALIIFWVMYRRKQM